MKLNNSAQVNILEVVIVAGMIFAALFFLQSLTVPSFPESYHTKMLRSRADTALISFDTRSDDEYHSLLVRYLMTDDGKVKEKFFLEFFNFTFPSYGFSIYLINLTKMYENSTYNEKDYKELYVTSNPPQIGVKTQASRIFVNDGILWEVLIEMWYV